jgi:uncharacterized membrane protein
MKFKTKRMEALTDGIFAIIMTVMIVSLNEVLNFKGPVRNEDFYTLFLSLIDDFAVYALSFLILGFMWFEHHWQFHFIRYVDPVLIFINIVWFMFLCIIPFSTMMVGNFPVFFAPLIAFEANILLVFIPLVAHWAYAAREKGCLEAALDRKIVRSHRNIGLVVIAAVTLMIALTCYINLAG